MIKIKSSLKPLIELSIAGALWGFGFIGTVWALPFLSPTAIIFYRFAGAFVLGGAFLLLAKTSKASLKYHFKLALVPAAFLFPTLILQTWGLQTTSATNSSFITTLYVIMVPLMRGLAGHEKLNFRVWMSVLLAFIGTGFIVQIQNLSEVRFGDFLTLLCAVSAAFHLIYMGKIAPKSTNDFATNVFQSFWICLFCMFILPFDSKWSLTGMDQNAWIGMLSLAFGSSLIAFYLQVRAQKKVTPSVAGIMFLLESPFACLFAFMFLGEIFNAWQWFGSGLIIAACVNVTLLESKKVALHPKP